MAINRGTYFSLKQSKGKVLGARYAADQMPTTDCDNGWTLVKRRRRSVRVPTTETLQLQLQDGCVEEITITWLPDHQHQDGGMKANIKNVQRLLCTAHAHYSQVRPDVEGGMVGIGQHGQSYLRRVCFHRATTGCKNEDHEKAVETQVAFRLGDLAPTFHKTFGEKMQHPISSLQMYHPHRLWRQRFR